MKDASSVRDRLAAESVLCGEECRIVGRSRMWMGCGSAEGWLTVVRKSGGRKQKNLIYPPIAINLRIAW